MPWVFESSLRYVPRRGCERAGEAGAEDAPKGGGQREQKMYLDIPFIITIVRSFDASSWMSVLVLCQALVIRDVMDT